MKVLKILGVGLLVVVLAAAAFYGWASIRVNRLLSRTVETHVASVPVPFPLSAEEIRRLRLNPARAGELAREQAMERGRHLLESRYACAECHGRDFSGGVMVDAAPIGRLFGPNLTAGQGSRTTGYSPADWDRIVRHGVRRDSTPAVMPSEDYRAMTDQELSDIIVFLGSQPAVDNVVPARELGPLGKILMATGRIRLSADMVESHDAPHAVRPPEPAVTVELGRHIAQTCTGCHHADLAGGKIPGGDPSWVPAANLTSHPSGLGGWTYEQFRTAMQEGRRPDETMLRAPMMTVIPYAQRMTPVELEALWTYVQSVPAVPSRN
jgi:cytochrome c553